MICIDPVRCVKVEGALCIAPTAAAAKQSPPKEEDLDELDMDA